MNFNLLRIKKSSHDIYFLFTCLPTAFKTINKQTNTKLAPVSLIITLFVSLFSLSFFTLPLPLSSTLSSVSVSFSFSFLSHPPFLFLSVFMSLYFHLSVCLSLSPPLFLTLYLSYFHFLTVLT